MNAGAQKNVKRVIVEEINIGVPSIQRTEKKQKLFTTQRLSNSETL